MNYELIMAFIVLWFGFKFITGTLKTGNHEQFLEKSLQKLNENRKAIGKMPSAYYAAYVIKIVIGAFMLYVSLSYIFDNVSIN